MIIIHNGSQLQINWTIFKGMSKSKEDFRRALLRVFLVRTDMVEQPPLDDMYPVFNQAEYADYVLHPSAEAYADTLPMNIVSVENGTIKIDIPQSVMAQLPVGVYSLKAVWFKNKQLLHDATNVGVADKSYSIVQNKFAITDVLAEATNPEIDDPVLNVQSGIATYGYNGLDSYEEAVLNGETLLSRGLWIANLSEMNSRFNEIQLEWDNEDEEEPGLKQQVEAEIDKAEDKITDVEERMTSVEIQWGEVEDEAEAKISDVETRMGNIENDWSTLEGNITTEEQQWQLAESTRQTQESDRQTQEAERVTAEAARVTHENSRISSEDTRASKESQRQSNESTRQSQESTRQSNESTRQSQETARETQASADHTQATTDHATAAADHTTAQSDHTTAQADHTTATTDHNKQVQSTTIEYAEGEDNTTAPVSGWQESIPSVDAGNYLWTRTTFTYADNTTKVAYGVSLVPTVTVTENTTNGGVDINLNGSALPNGNVAKQSDLSQLSLKVDNITGTPEEAIDLSLVELQSGQINRTTLVYKNTGGYSSHRYKIIKPIKGRTVHIIPISTVLQAAVLPLKDIDFVDGNAVNACAGYTEIEYHYTPFIITIPDDCNYLYIYCRDSSLTNYEPTMKYLANSGLLNSKVDKVQGKGLSTNDFTDAHIEELDGAYTKSNIMYPIVTKQQTMPIAVPLIMHVEGGVNGYWNANSHLWTADDTRRGSEKIDVTEGDKYLVTTKIGGSTVIAYLAQWNGDSWVGVATGFTGGSGDAVDKEYIVPTGVNKIAVCSYDSTEPSLKKVVAGAVPNVYTKQEANELFAPKSIKAIERYGIKWSVSDNDDLGSRCFNAEGKTATIAIGVTGGQSDFDNIFPWSEMRRCNIKKNANGAKIVTFEGETGFALDGSNGDVFVRIPKFSVEKYVKDGYEYRVISNDALHIHPAFIEDGKELDEIFISAFEASESNGELNSIEGVIPANNITAQTFLNYAQAKGNSYSLFDSRCVDLLYTLIAVEFGCRNTNQILGYGYSGYIQAAQYQNWSHCAVSQTATNSITIGKPASNSERLKILTSLAVGQNICICGNSQDGSQNNIIAQRHITNITCNTVDDNVVIAFDGEPIDVDAEVSGSTNYTYVGNAPITCNYCENVTDTDAAMSYHTGRTNRDFTPNTGELFPNTANVCRYRWIENPIGNVWQFLPDVTFVNNQMYVCDNMRDYVCHKHITPYRPIGALLPTQDSNGNKRDIANANFWVTSLFNDTFAKGIVFGKTFDESLVSSKAFGAYYYLKGGNTPYIISHGGGFDHLWRCNLLTMRAWQYDDIRWYLYGARLMFKNINE